MKKLGLCLICGDRVKSDDLHVTAEEGYAHTKCLSRRKQLASASA